MPTGGLNYPMQYQVRSEALKQKVREEKAKQIQKGQEEMAKRFGLRKLAVKTAYDMVFEQAHIGIEPVDAPFYSMKKRCTLYPYKVACQGQTVRIEVVRVRYGWMDGRFILVPQNTTKNPPTHPPTSPNTPQRYSKVLTRWKQQLGGPVKKTWNPMSYVAKATESVKAAAMAYNPEMIEGRVMQIHQMLSELANSTYDQDTYERTGELRWMLQLGSLALRLEESYMEAAKKEAGKAGAEDAPMVSGA